MQIVILACKDLKYLLERFHLIYLLESSRKDDAEMFYLDHLIKYQHKYQNVSGERAKWYTLGNLKLMLS